MEMLKNLMETITGMGATAILPLVIFILGLVFRGALLNKSNFC